MFQFNFIYEAKRFQLVKYPSDYISQCVTKLYALVQQLCCLPASPPPSPFPIFKKWKLNTGLFQNSLLV